MKAIQRNGTAILSPRMEADHEPPSLNSKRAKCLYADDNKLLRTMMSKMLATLDIEADIANEGNEAFELLKKNSGQYSFTIFDMEMGEGEMNGHIAIKRWRQKEEESKMEALPMYILTANSDESMKSNCLTCGATDVLSKPISREKLKEIVKKHLPPTLPERHSSSLYRKCLKTWDFGFEKASRLNDRKPPHISNIRWLTTIQSRELSLCQKPNFETLSVYTQTNRINASAHP